jgi:hypothetical protein
MQVFGNKITRKIIPENQDVSRQELRLKRDVYLPAGCTIRALHFSPTDRALVHCISATIRPDPGHRCHIMIIVTGWYLKFCHILFLTKK